MNGNDQLTAEIEDFLAEYAQAYNRQDYATLLGMWDEEDPDVLYMAEEVDPPMQGWSRLRRYFDPRPGVQVLDGIRNRYTQVRARLLAPGLALASWRLDFEIKVMRVPAIGSWDRCIGLFRQRGQRWKMFLYAEAPMGPLTMVRGMLQSAVDEDFADFIAAQKGLARPPQE
ncbi:MAG: nuclear transport factor 2 family protein [Chromatiales bacterium]|nr:nuclear transport factor 2 family protein [Chromatiales bacterium]